MSDLSPSAVVPAPADSRTSAVKLAAALLLFLLLIASFIVRGPMGAIYEKGRASSDFSPVYAGARAWLHGGDAYDTPTVQAEFHAGGGDRIFLPSVYPPPLFPIVALVAWAPWPVAKWMWLAVDLLAWAAALWCVMKMIPWKPPLWLIPVAWGLVCWPAVMTIRLAQPSMLCCALTVWSIWFAIRNRFIAGGIALALAAGCKPTVAAAAVFFCLLQRKFKTLFVGGLTFAILYGAVMLTAWPGSLHWLDEQRANMLPFFVPGGDDDPLPSGPQVTDFVNLQPVIALFTPNLTLGNAIVFLALAGLLIAFYFMNRNGGLEKNAPAALTLSVALAMMGIYHRYHDLILIVAIIPACYSLYERRRYRMLAAVAGIVLVLSVPTQTYLSQKLMLNPALRSDQPLEYARVLLLFHHQALLLLALALLSFRILNPGPARSAPAHPSS